MPTETAVARARRIFFHRLVGLVVAIGLSSSSLRAAEWLFWPSASIGYYRDGNVDVVGPSASDDVVRIGVGLDLSAKSLSTKFLLSYDPYHDAYQEQSDLTNTSHRLSTSYTHEASRRSSFHAGLSGWLSDRSQVRTARPDLPATLVPRTRQTSVDLDVSGRIGTGRKSFVELGGDGDMQRYEDPALEDTTTLGASFGWGVELDPKMDVGVRVRGRWMNFQTQPSNTTGALTGFLNREFGRSTHLSASLGAVRFQGAGSDETNPTLEVDIAHTYQHGSVLSGGAHQDVSAGWGGSAATLDRGVYMSLAPGSRTQKLQANLTAYAWRRENVDPAGTPETVRTLEGTASLEWRPGRGHFALGGFYSYHDQTDLEGTNLGLDTKYSTYGVLLRWTFRVEAAERS